MASAPRRLRRHPVTVLALFAVVLLTACSGSNEEDPVPGGGGETTESPAEPAAADQGPATATESPAPEPDTAEVVARQLEAGLTADPVTVMSAEAEFTEVEAREGLPRGSEVEVHQDSWSPIGAGRSGVVVITATQPSGLEGTFAAVVQLEDRDWKILSTYAVERP